MEKMKYPYLQYLAFISILFVISISLSGCLDLSSRITVSGFVTDEASLEPLSQCKVLLYDVLDTDIGEMEMLQETVTNEEGYFEFSSVKKNSNGGWERDLFVEFSKPLYFSGGSVYNNEDIDKKLKPGGLINSSINDIGSSVVVDTYICIRRVDGLDFRNNQFYQSNFSIIEVDYSGFFKSFLLESGEYQIKIYSCDVISTNWFNLTINNLEEYNMYPHFHLESPKISLDITANEDVPILITSKGEIIGGGIVEEGRLSLLLERLGVYDLHVSYTLKGMIYENSPYKININQTRNSVELDINSYSEDSD